MYIYVYVYVCNSSIQIIIAHQLENFWFSVRWHHHDLPANFNPVRKDSQINDKSNHLFPPSRGKQINIFETTT